MSYKQFITSLTDQQIMAFACQHGFKEWKLRERASMVSYLNKNEVAKATFRRVYE